MAEVRVGAVHHEEVREPGDRDAAVRARAVGPGRVEPPSGGALDGHRGEERRRLEAGREDDGVDGVHAAVAADHRVLANVVDAVRHDLDVRATERLVVVVGDQDALPADRVVRQQDLAEARIGDRVLDVPLGQATDDLREHAAAAEEREAHLEVRPDPPAVEPRDAGNVAAEPLLPRPVGAVAARQHPVGAPLEDREVRDTRRDLRDELDGARRVADHRDALAGEIVRVVPASRVEALAPEPLEARDRRDRRPVQLPDGAHQHVGRRLGTARRADAPGGRVVVPARPGDLRPEADVAEDVVLPRAMIHVVPDLLLRRPLPRPVGLLLEGEAVGERRHVARGARVRVVAPRPAEAIRLLEDREAVDAELLQTDAEAEAGEARPDDRQARRIRGHRGEPNR